MPLAERTADATWHGNLKQGSGNVTTASSGVLKASPVTWASRTETADGKTSPEELIAAAHAACFAMAFSNTLDQNGTPPTELNVSATCSLDRVDGKMKITAMRLRVQGKVPNLDAAQFQQIAQQAEQGCPVSNALRNNVTIQVEATLG